MRRLYVPGTVKFCSKCPLKLPRETKFLFYMKQDHKKGEKNKIGAYGEQITVNYLRRLGFSIIATNYLRKWGEIDIIAKNSTGNIHFIEVKTVSYETKLDLEKSVTSGQFKPEDNIHTKKLRRIYRTIESWLAEKNYHGEWQIDVASVRIVPREKYATIKYIKNIIC